MVVGVMCRLDYSALRRIACALGVSVVITTPCAAAPLAEASWRGGAQSQIFLGDNVSAVVTGDVNACVASALIDIERSLYIDGASGQPVAFDLVTRSYGSSVQLIAHADGRRHLRIQAKYPIDPAQPVTITIAEEDVDVRAALEPSGDSLLITDADVVARLGDAAGAFTPVRLAAHSRDTRRLVVDDLPSWSADGLADCLESLQTIAEKTVPANALGVTFTAAPDEAAKATLAEARACKIERDADRLYVGSMTRADGFYSPSDRIFVLIDDAGRMYHAQIPGIFRADLGPDGDFEVSVSVAADSNTPTTTNATSGCLGMEKTRLCVSPDSDLGSGSFRLEPCFGDFLIGDLEEPVFAIGDLEPDRFARSPSNPAASGFGGPAPFGFGGGGFGGGGGSGRGGIPGGGGGPGGGDPTPPEVLPIPLPPAALLLVTALAAGAAVGRRGSRSPRRGSGPAGRR
ncbi:MAG: hypothetical protein ACK4WC_06950 [Rubrimonas sp.]